VLNKLTQEHVDRAFRIAHWYGRRARRVEISDLESAALEGLAKAARDFDPEVPSRRRRRKSQRGSFWTFAFKKILGEMKDELRRLDHLTRDQRAMVAEDGNGVLIVEHDDLGWINPQEPVALDAPVAHDDETAPAIVDLLEEPNDPIESLELRDAFCRATAALPERQRFVLLMRELEGYSNSELADAFDVTEGRASQLRGAAIERMRDEIGDSFVDAA
jgi:RNA polymerase sigma factor (sigma-70 family)